MFRILVVKCHLLCGDATYAVYCHSVAFADIVKGTDGLDFQKCALGPTIGLAWWSTNLKKKLSIPTATCLVVNHILHILYDRFLYKALMLAN